MTSETVDKARLRETAWSSSFSLVLAFSTGLLPEASAKLKLELHAVSRKDRGRL